MEDLMEGVSMGVGIAGSGIDTSWMPSLGGALPGAAIDFVGKRGFQSGAGVAHTGMLVATRSSIATYFGSDGVMRNAAVDELRYDYDPSTLLPLGLLGEGASTNMMLQSEDLSSGSYTTAGATVTANAVVAPDGTTTADQLDIPSAAGQGRYQVFTVTASTQYTFSMYIKLGTLTAAQATMAFRDDTGAAFIALDVALSPTPNTTTWTRVTFTVTTPVGCLLLRVYPLRSPVAGFGAGNAFYWGLQIEQAASASSYIKTTTAAVTRSTDVIRISDAAFAAGLVTSATNLMLQSQTFEVGGAGWTNSNVTVTANTTTSPTATLTGDTITCGNAVGQGIYQAMTVLPNTTYTFSVYVQLLTMLAADYKVAFRDDTAGAFISQDVAPSTAPVGGSWTRCTFTVTTPVGCTLLRVYPFRNNTALTTTVALWGAQLELGDVATPYIVTVAAAASLTAFAEATWMIDAITDASTPASAVLGGIANTTGNFNDTIYTTGSPISSVVRSGGAAQTAFATVAGNTRPTSTKHAVAFRVNDFATSTKGAAALTDTAGALPATSMDRFFILSAPWSPGANSPNGWIRYLHMYPTRRTNANLVSMST